MGRVHDTIISGMLRDFLRDELSLFTDEEGHFSQLGNICGIMGLCRADVNKLATAAKKRLAALEKQAGVLSDRRIDWRKDIVGEGEE